MSDVDSLKSWSSAGITSTQSCSESSEYRGQGRRPLAAVGINTQGILDCQFDAIINRYLGTSEYVTKTVSAAEVMDAVKLLTEESKNSDSSLRNIPIAFNPENVQLTEADLALRPAEIKDEPTIDDWNDDTKEVAAEFEAYYGTSIRSVIPNDNEAYLDFSRSSTETQEKLNQLLATSTAKSLASKCTLTADIEQQFAIAPLRVSSRQKKKTLAETRKGTLPNWFDMPRVTEITKEQEKDLAALKMRHVWNSKSFYKKSCLNDVGQSGPDTSKFFQLGTVIEDKTDFYADRVPKKQRKQTIVDELMADQEAKANQKRKIAAMMSNGRQRLMMLKAKQRRQKKRIKERKDDKYEKAIGDAGMKKQVNAFRTYEL